MITLTVRGDGLDKFEEAVEALGSRKKAHAAYRRGINKAGSATFTQVKRVVAKQMGTTQGAVVKYGKMRRIPAKGEALTTTIFSKGNRLPTKIFGARLTRKGISAAPWGNRRIFGGTFIVQSLGGNVFRNTGGKNEKSGRDNAIEAHWGPGVPTEMVRGESKKAFETLAPKILREETQRQITLMTKGVVT